MAKILTIGSVTKDTFLPTNEGIIIETPEDLLCQKKIAFELGAKYHISEKHETLGGCPINVAAGMARLGLDVKCLAPIGDDETGNWIRNELERQGIDTDHLVVIEGRTSDASSIVIDKNSGERVIFSGHDASEKFEILPGKIADCQLVFIGDLSGDWKGNLDVIISDAKKSGIPIAFNPRLRAIRQDGQKIVETLSFCDFLFINKDEALEILASTNAEISDSEDVIVKRFKELGVGIVALTDGVRGAWAFDGKDVFHVDALLHSNTVDTTGAGDAFASGFLSANLKGRDLLSALKWGIANSSNSITEYGGQKGLLTEEKIVAIASQLK